MLQIAPKLQGDCIILVFQKILISVRNQVTAIKSIYKQYIKTGGVLSFEKYFNDDKKIVEKHFSFNQFDYWPLVELYCILFRKENVCILPLEYLKDDKKTYLKKIELFLGDQFDSSVYNSISAHNKGMSNLSLKTMRILNHFTYSYFKPSNLLSNKFSSYRVNKILSKTVDPLVYKFNKKEKTFISESNKKRIIQYYKGSNKKLNDYFNLNLQNYNYPL